MRKSIFVSYIAVFVAFVAAVGLCIRALHAPQTVFSAADAGMKIVLDAGHGGVDGGVTGKTTGVKESDINLAITRKLKIALEEVGFEVVLTRKTEGGLYDTATKGFKKRDMERRKQIVQEEKPALVISVHQNLYPTRSVRGAQVFYNGQNEKSTKLAREMQTKLNGLYAKERVKARKETAAEYFMLSCSDAPAIIVECGFLSNPDDEKLLISEGWQVELSKTLTAGVLSYFSGSVS